MYQADMFEWLDELRDSGKTNMFGAAPYLQEAYGLTHSEASKVLKAWMKTFDGKSSASERAAAAARE